MPSAQVSKDFGEGSAQRAQINWKTEKKNVGDVWLQRFSVMVISQNL